MAKSWAHVTISFVTNHLKQRKYALLAVEHAAEFFVPKVGTAPVLAAAEREARG